LYEYAENWILHKSRRSAFKGCGLEEVFIESACDVGEDNEKRSNAAEALQ